MRDDENRWWAYGEYTGDRCKNCGRERVVRSQDPSGKQRDICEKCRWDQAANDYALDTERE